jgi:hypothetical protein
MKCVKDVCKINPRALALFLPNLFSAVIDFIISLFVSGVGVGVDDMYELTNIHTHMFTTRAGLEGIGRSWTLLTFLVRFVWSKAVLAVTDEEAAVRY